MTKYICMKGNELLQMISESIPNLDMGLCLSNPVRDIYLYGHVILWNTTKMPYLHGGDCDSLHPIGVLIM